MQQYARTRAIFQADILLPGLKAELPARGVKHCDKGAAQPSE
jgi:hypothetical protein